MLQGAMQLQWFRQVLWPEQVPAALGWEPGDATSLLYCAVRCSEYLLDNADHPLRCGLLRVAIRQARGRSHATLARVDPCKPSP